MLFEDLAMTQAPKAWQNPIINCFHQRPQCIRQRRTASFIVWLMVWRFGLATTVSKSCLVIKNCEHLCMVLVSDLREADLFSQTSRTCPMCISLGVGCFFRSHSWGFFFWGNIPGAMIPRRTLQTLLLVEKPMSCWEAWILKKEAVGWHLTLTIALVGWDISMPSSEILSNST